MIFHGKNVIEDIECIYCSKLFWAYEGNVCQVETTCGKCYMDMQPWMDCPDCGHRVIGPVCGICEGGLK